VAIQRNGKVVVLARNVADFQPFDFYVARLNKDGSLDNSFDGDGTLTIDFGGSRDFATSMALQPDGRIVLAGFTEVGGTYDFAVAHLKKNGSLDTSFDGDGKQLIDFGGGNDGADDVVIQKDGKIVVVGSSEHPQTGSDFALARLEAKGNKKSPKISISNVEQVEGSSGSTPFTFTIRLSRRSQETVTVKYRTVDGSAVEVGEDPDITAASGTLTFAPGEKTKTVTVWAHGDADGEFNEEFKVLLSQPTHAAIADAWGLGTIIDDDIRISIDDATQVEGPDGQTILLTFTVTISDAFDDTVTLGYFTSDNTAWDGEDYLGQEGTLTFAAGETSKTITIEVIGDSIQEEDEDFNVRLSAEPTLYKSIIKSWGIGTILNDD
jgi:uncharacterized delta-60 repeat protein